MADGHVCQLPRDLREAPNRSAFLEGRTFSPFLLLLNAEPVDKTIYQVLLWFLGTFDFACPCDLSYLSLVRRMKDVWDTLTSFNIPTYLHTF